MLSRPGEGGDILTPDEIEILAGLAHERWWAAKALAGWHYGSPRDDRAMLHPDMLPYDQLAEPVKQKDRDEVASLAPMAALAGETLQRERRVAIASPLDGPALASLRKNLAASPKGQVPVAVLAMDRPEMLDLAEALLAGGVAVEAVLDPSAAGLRRNDAVAPRLAGVLRQAWRIHTALGRTAALALPDRARDIGNGKE